MGHCLDQSLSSRADDLLHHRLARVDAGAQKAALSRFFFYVLWLRASINNLMPVARIGGEIMAVRVMIKHGIRKTSAIASTVVEITMSVIAVFLFDAHRHRHVHLSYRREQYRLLQLAWGLLLSMPVIAGLVVIQRVGIFRLADEAFHPHVPRQMEEICRRYGAARPRGA